MVALGEVISKNPLPISGPLQSIAGFVEYALDLAQ